MCTGRQALCLPLRQARALDGKAPLPLYGLAQVAVRQREYGRAVPLLEEALAAVRAPGHAPPWCRMLPCAALS